MAYGEVVMVVYKATNHVNGKAYVGVTQQTLAIRIVQHKSRAKHLPAAFYGAIRKYGWNSFTWEVLHTCESVEELKRLEVLAIEIHNTRADGGWGYNRTEGGGGVLGYCFSAESRKRMSERRKGRIKSIEERAKLSAALKGRKPSCSRKGFKASEETKAKIRANHVGRRGKKNSASQNDALRIGRLKAAKLKPEIASAVAHRRVVMGDAYSAIARDYGVTPSAVFYFCKREGIRP